MGRKTTKIRADGQTFSARNSTVLSCFLGRKELQVDHVISRIASNQREHVNYGADICLELFGVVRGNRHQVTRTNGQLPIFSDSSICWLKLNRVSEEREILRAKENSSGTEELEIEIA